MDNDEAWKIVFAILDDIYGRSGGDHWFESMNEEVRDEIKDRWFQIVSNGGPIHF